VKVKRSGLAVYAGSFDPLTVGHLWMIEEGCRIFSKLRVAIGINPDKKYYFSLEERLEMLTASTRGFRNVSIGSFSNLYLVDYAQEIGATHILRGIRSQADFEFERTMRNINGDFDPGITTVFLMPPRDIAEVSSSMVKGLMGPQGWERIVKRYVPGAVYQRLLKGAQ
jgi:pantetheine-phosphate adenylyltransferase